MHAAAREWVEALDRVAAAAPRIALLELRYEDFCGDVHGALRTLLDHAELDPEVFPFWRCPRTLDVRNARWLEEASDRELADISAIEHEMLVRHGYEAGVGALAAPERGCVIRATAAIIPTRSTGITVSAWPPNSGVSLCQITAASRQRLIANVSG